MPSFRSFAIAAAPLIGRSKCSSRELARSIGRKVDNFTDASPRQQVTPGNAAQFIIGALAGGPQARAGDRVLALIAAEVDDGTDAHIVGTPEQKSKPCGITGAVLLIDAVFAILSRPELTAEIDRIEVRADANEATITATDGRATRFSSLAIGSAAACDMRTVSSLSGTALATLANLIHGQD